MLAPTAQRVEMHTRPEVVEHLHEQTERRLTYFKYHPQHIADRLAELDREWDIERAIETQFGTLTLLGTTLGLATRNRWWLLLAGVPAAFMVLHALHGWCPPVPLLRALGVRTAREIESERCALKSMVREDVSPGSGV